MNIPEFIALCDIHAKKFEEDTRDISFNHSGIFFWEAFAVCMMSFYHKIELLIESGTARGISTEIFGRFLPFPVITIDNAGTYGKEIFEETKTRLKKYDNITCLLGNSDVRIPEILHQYKGGKVGVFLDGPKGG